MAERLHSADPPAAVEPADAPPIDLRRSLAAFRRSAVVIVALVIAVTAIAYQTASNVAPRYRATARLIQDPTATAATADPVAADRELATARSLATSATVLDAAGRGLPDVPPDALARTVGARIVTPDDVLKITATAGEPATAARIANTVAAALIAERARVKRATAVRTRQALTRTLRRERRAHAAKSVLEALRVRLSAAVADEATTGDDLRLVDAAAVPAAPYAPKPGRNAALAALSALLIGLLVALARDRLHPRTEDPEGLSRALGLPLLAVFREPRRGGRARRAAHRAAVVVAVAGDRMAVALARAGRVLALLLARLVRRAAAAAADALERPRAGASAAAAEPARKPGTHARRAPGATAKSQAATRSQARPRAQATSRTQATAKTQARPRAQATSKTQATTKSPTTSRKPGKAEPKPASRRTPPAKPAPVATSTAGDAAATVRAALARVARAVEAAGARGARSVEAASARAATSAGRPPGARAVRPIGARVAGPSAGRRIFAAHAQRALVGAVRRSLPATRRRQRVLVVCGIARRSAVAAVARSLAEGLAESGLATLLVFAGAAPASAVCDSAGTVTPDALDVEPIDRSADVDAALDRLLRCQYDYVVIAGPHLGRGAELDAVARHVRAAIVVGRAGPTTVAAAAHARRVLDALGLHGLGVVGTSRRPAAQPQDAVVAVGTRAANGARPGEASSGSLALATAGRSASNGHADGPVAGSADARASHND
jgi:capsular polysaccharide biosynthesis protein